MSADSRGEVGGMKRGRTERETCDLNGWGVGTVLQGHEVWANGDGIWTTIRLTALGETAILARAIRSERTFADGSSEPIDDRVDRESTWTLACREWATPPTTDETRQP